MDVTKPTTIKSLIAKYNLSIRKSWGQNFMTSPQAISNIAGAADLTALDHVLEVGPGLGALTEELLQQAGHVTALEIDPRLCTLLADRFGGFNNFTLVSGDALKYDYSLLPRPYKVVANLPYYITSPFLFKLIEGQTPPKLAVLLVQLEVARRLAAEPGTSDYSSMTVAVQYNCQVELITKVGSGNFYPPPKVESAVVKLTWHQQLPWQPTDSVLMGKLVRLAFGQRRKMLKKLVAKGLDLPADQVSSILEEMNLPPGVRGEQLSVRDFVTLTNHLGELR